MTQYHGIEVEERWRIRTGATIVGYHLQMMKVLEYSSCLIDQNLNQWDTEKHETEYTPLPETLGQLFLLQSTVREAMNQRIPFDRKRPPQWSELFPPQLHRELGRLVVMSYALFGRFSPHLLRRCWIWHAVRPHQDEAEGLDATDISRAWENATRRMLIHPDYREHSQLLSISVTIGDHDLDHLPEPVDFTRHGHHQFGWPSHYLDTVAGNQAIHNMMAVTRRGWAFLQTAEP